MKQFSHWKSVAWATLVSLLIALHPVITYAAHCDVAGSHVGC